MQDFSYADAKVFIGGFLILHPDLFSQYLPKSTGVFCFKFMFSYFSSFSNSKFDKPNKFLSMSMRYVTIDPILA